ncbi:MAG: YgiQ family radical SAM protein, partial [Clostridia bacterium]
GDAYVDHPSFALSVITRVLTAANYRVGVIAQPDWRSAEPFKALGRPKLGIFIGAGNLDSMVAHYTAAKKPRSRDLYSPGGRPGLRPDRAVVVYANRAREAFPGVPIIIGGIEASLRRLAHYDYWQDKVRRSVLFDSRADLLSYGMGETATLEIADALAAGCPVSRLRHIRGTCYAAGTLEDVQSDYVLLPSFEAVASDKRKYAEATRIAFYEQDHVRGKTLVQPHGNRYLVQNPPMPPLSGAALDAVYELPYARRAHPMYDDAGGVPALSEVQFSITSSRGCFGSCNFCSLTFHQGRVVTARSHESILREAAIVKDLPGFKGYIHDVGGPTANFRRPACEKQLRTGTCRDKRCLYPKPCAAIRADHSDYRQLLQKLRALPYIKKVFVRSGIRFDYLLADQNDAFFRDLLAHHVSGQLKVAPEHIADKVLAAMGKPANSVYEAFRKKFRTINEELGKAQYLVPYLMSGHPGSTLKEAIELAVYLRREKIRPEQVQDFYPTPGSVSTAMYYTGLDPFTMQPVYVPKGEDKAMQRALLQAFLPENRPLVLKALKKAGREDLIGFGPDCLIPPRPLNTERKVHDKSKNTGGNDHDKSKNSGREGRVSENPGRVKARGGRTDGKGHSSRPGRHHRGR